MRYPAFRTTVRYALLLSWALGFAAWAQTAPVSLAGAWSFRMLEDGPRVVDDGATKIQLPGSMDEAGYGHPVTETSVWHLNRLHEYVGPALYWREVEIPESWQGKRIVLFLERCHWKSQVWVDKLDGEPLGMCDSLCTPHEHDLSRVLTPGKHTLYIEVDNRIQYAIGEWGHSVTEHTQSNWNGIVGRIELQATAPLWIDDIQVYPHVAAKTIDVKVTFGNATGAPAAGALNLMIKETDTVAVTGSCVSFKCNEAKGSVDATFPIIDSAERWDEFSPGLCELTASFRSASGVGMRKLLFGLRDFEARDGLFLLNGRPMFLRGTLECCIFPLTGYPSMEVAAWKRILGVAQSYGLNHLRFHSWCPPEAAFAAADEMGFIYHVELPLWAFNVGKEPKRDQFERDEMDRILKTYGNHPSFGMLCMGNELEGDFGYLESLVKHGQEVDRRHLYTCSTARKTTPTDDYRVTHATERGPIRDLRGPQTDWDFGEAVADLRVPVVSHEIGQWTIYPNFDEIPKYTGVFRARNFEVFRDDLNAKHLGDCAKDYVRATGAFMLLLYKEEMEAALRTPSFDGFQLLDLRDFPGQGTALVGTLDPFWDSKGLIAPEAFRRYCGPTVPLLRMSKRVWTTAETFTARAEVNHYGPDALQDVKAVWSIANEAGTAIASGEWRMAEIPTGGIAPLGAITASLANVQAPAKLIVSVSLDGTPFTNQWDIWVYPTEPQSKVPDGIQLATAWDDAARNALRDGKTVALFFGRGAPLYHAAPLTFKPIFWSPLWFKGQPGTMSLLCDPKHPALALFPSESHTNWQWWDVFDGSRLLDLSATPAEFRPAVQMIDNFVTNRKLGLVIEARVGKGKLLATALDLETDLDKRIAARQLRRSLLAYAASPDFSPAQTLELDAIEVLFGQPPACKLRGEPRDTKRAALHVRAATRMPKNVSNPWKREQDDIRAKKNGFDYAIEGGSWLDETSSAWHDGNLRVKVTCPKGFKGTLYVHLHDWNQAGRVAAITLDGADLGQVDDYSGPGLWLALPITEKESADGALEVAATSLRGPNAMISEIVVVPGE